MPDHADAAGGARRRSDRVASEGGWPPDDIVADGADRTKVPARVAACNRMMARLEEGVSLGGVKFDREEIHERKDRQSYGCD